MGIKLKGFKSGKPGFGLPFFNRLQSFGPMDSGLFPPREIAGRDAKPGPLLGHGEKAVARGRAGERAGARGRVEGGIVDEKIDGGKFVVVGRSAAGPWGVDDKGKSPARKRAFLSVVEVRRIVVGDGSHIPSRCPCDLGILIEDIGADGLAHFPVGSLENPSEIEDCVWVFVEK